MKISIITICYNAEKHIEDCLKSVANQTYGALEHIVVDGGSTDETMAIIRKYDNYIAKWVSEKDRGISDAMNKGIRMAQGNYILFLHSDDYLLSDDAVENAVGKMELNADIHAFSVLLGSNGQGSLKKSRSFGMRTWFKTPVMHQGAFCRRDIFNSIGDFDEQFSITMDYDFFIRAFISECSLICHNMPISFMRDTGISSQKDWHSLMNRFSEEKKVHFKNNRNPALRLIYRVYWLLYPLYRLFLFKFKKNHSYHR